MNVSCNSIQTVEYHCPGQPYPISREVHLGRLAAFYPGCRQCPHRDDTGTLSPRQVERLIETRPRGLPRALFRAEGIAGTYLDDLHPPTARRAAAALGVFLQRRLAAGDTQQENGPPVVAVAGDGRPMSCTMVAAVGEGLRWAGCHVVDVGSASAACLAFAVDHLPTAGGVLVGNPDGRPNTVGLKFWAPSPLSAGEPLDSLEQMYRQGVDRPTRDYGSLRRFQAEAPYLAALAGHYHALRPLRIVLDTSCGPVAGYLERLTQPVACRIVRCGGGLDRLREQVAAHKAHFGVRIGDDGETCSVFDEQGRPVPAERLLLLVARHLWAEKPPGTIVLEEDTPPAVVASLRGPDCRVEVSDPHRAEMAATMRRHAAPFGGGPSGRFWYGDLGPPVPDALVTLTLLMVILSQSDRRLCEVLDRQTGPR